MNEEPTIAKNQIEAIEIPAVITVSDFAARLKLPVAKVVGELMKNGVMATVNEQIDFDTASIISSELGIDILPEPEKPVEKPSTTLKSDKNTKADDLQARPPIVAVMGHVDHGKTSLLDAIRNSNVASGEAGGITQHIGAYQVTKSDRVITFLDTPGHEAFAALREHGAKTCDVAVVVVAADDGVKPQTKEAIDHAKAADVALIIAITKTDKSGADVNRVKQELSEIGVVPDDWGGDIPCVEVSSKTQDGVDKLLEVILLVSDIAEPKALFTGLASGVVIESHIDTGKGPVATLLVQNGELKTGDWIVVGSGYGKIRSLEDFKGETLKKAVPAMPVQISGLKEMPEFGDWFEEVQTEKIAKDWASGQVRKASIKTLHSTKTMNATDLSHAVIDGKVKELALIIKADAQGSLESLLTTLAEIGNDEVRVKVVSSGIGDISETDINSAVASGAIVLGFHVGISSVVNQLAKRSSVEFRLYKIIYEMLDDVRDWLSALLPPEIVEHEKASLKILGVFKVTKSHVVCGGKVLAGKITPGLDVKVFDGAKEIGTATIDSLQRNKDVAKEVVEGDECGLNLITSAKIEVGNTLKFIEIESKPRRV
jgi:translation initiation factor IF-2